MEHLKELRHKKNLLQKEVAEALKIDRTTYAKYETGDSEPSFEILKRIARFYDVSTDYLLGYNEQEKNKSHGNKQLQLSDDEKVMIEQYRLLNTDGQKYILQALYVAVMSGIYKKCNDVSSMGKNKE